MSEPSTIHNPQSALPQGFTLLEVVVAIALLGILMAAAVELLAVGVRSAQRSADYTQGVMLGKRKLDEMALQPLSPGTLAGTESGGFRWSADIEPERQEAENLPARLFRLKVRVSWAGRSGEKAVELVTLRTAMVEGTTAPEPALQGTQARRSGMRGSSR